VSRVYLAAAARSIQADMAQISQTLAGEALQGFRPEEVKRLRDFLIRMRDNRVRANGE